MRAVSLPRYRPGPSLGRGRVHWYALVLVLLVLAGVVLLAIAVQMPTAEHELLAPFRWVRSEALA